MQYNEFENIVSPNRLQRYLQAANGNKQKATSLYKHNVMTSKEVFVVIAYFEIALRNKIDNILSVEKGADWLRDSVLPGGFLMGNKCLQSQKIVHKVYTGLIRDGKYTHSKLLSEMEFGVWKYMFSNPQYNASGKCLMRIFTNKPKSSATMQYNQAYIFNMLDHINKLRNRIAHHEPVCFDAKQRTKATIVYIEKIYNEIMTLLTWMDIDGADLLRGVNHVPKAIKGLETTIKRI